MPTGRHLVARHQTGRVTRIARAIVAIAALAAAVVLRAQAPRTLDIYFIDVEGGQSTLVVTPQGESLLVDAGFPGTGTFESRAGDPRLARDPGRIAAAARRAGVSRIDYLIVTHFHADHDGGVPELAQLLPIATFVDHGDVPPEAESVPGTLEVFRAYASARARGRHLQPKAGDRLPLKGVEALVVSTGGSIVAGPIDGAGGANPSCAAKEIPAQDPHENPRSTGVYIKFGRFRFLDLGDLSGKPLFDLACPSDRIGPVDVYLVAHHGGADAADPATLAAFRPRVAILNNGARKGAAPAMFTALRGASTVGDVWQLHRSELAGAANYADDRIANLDERTAFGIRLSAKEDGSFTMTNERTGASVSYPAK
jgi:beta-lactamase superfamily II metal-dependent hydrolase